MILLGLTGGIGSGKSTVSQLLAARGAVIIDADAITRELQAPGAALLGLIAEPVVITVAIAALSGVVFRRWFLLTAQGFYAIGFVFAYWLFYQSYTDIGALCPWCLLVTFTTTTVFMTMTRINILENNFGFSDNVHARLSRLLHLNVDSATVLIVWATLASLIIFRYA